MLNLLSILSIKIQFPFTDFQKNTFYLKYLQFKTFGTIFIRKIINK